MAELRFGGEPGAPCENVEVEVVVVTIGAVVVVVVGLVAIVPAVRVAGELGKGVVAVGDVLVVDGRVAGAVDRTALLEERLPAVEPRDCANAGLLASKTMVKRLAEVRRLRMSISDR